MATVSEATYLTTEVRDRPAALAAVAQLGCFSLGIFFGFTAGPVIRLALWGGLARVATAVFFVALGLAIRSRFHDHDPVASHRWAAVGLGSMGAFKTAMPLANLSATPSALPVRVGLAAVGFAFLFAAWFAGSGRLNQMMQTA